MEPGPVLSFAGVEFTYRGGGPGLRGADLEVHAGETVLVLGASGSGKSTLCLTANGLIPHFVRGDFSGRVTAAGCDTRGRSVRDFAPEVGVVFQDFESQLVSTTAELEVAFGPENLGLPREEIRRRVTSSLSRTGLAGYEGRFPGTLSGGEKQRLVIASALAVEPSVLVFDEPTSDLDPRGREEVHAVARHLGREGGAALLIAEPEVADGARADRVAVLDEGRIVLAGPAAEVLGRVPELLAAGIRPPAAAEVTHRLGLEVTPDDEAAAATIRGAGFRPVVPARAQARTQDGPAVLSARRLSFSYPGRPAVLAPTDLTIAEGDFVALLGRNGSGKTTLAKLLAGILRPTEGSTVRKGRAGFVFQNPDHQIFAETVAAEVAFGPRLQGLPSAEVETRVEEALASVNLLDKRGSDPYLLSKGERQRVAVASVLAGHPEVLVLDEPTTGLDYREVREMMALVSRLNAQGHSVVIITHAMWVAAEYARRVLVLEEGRVIADGPPGEVFFQPDVLERAGLKPPGAATLAARLGLRALSPEGIVACLGRD